MCDVRTVNVMISTWFHIKQHAGNGLAWFKYKINSITYTSNDTHTGGELNKTDPEKSQPLTEIVETKDQTRTDDDDDDCALVVVFV